MPVLETKSLERLGIRVQNPRVFHALSGVDRKLLRTVERDGWRREHPHTQSGASEEYEASGSSAMRDRRHPAKSGTTTSGPTCGLKRRRNPATCPPRGEH